MDKRYQPYLVRNNNRKTPWIRMIQMYIGTYEFSKRWQDVVDKVSFEAVKQLAITVHQFIQHPLSSNVPVDLAYSPLHIAAQNGNLSLFLHVLKRSSDQIPRTLNGWTPHHFAAGKGHLEIYKLIVEEIENKNPADNKGFIF